MCVRDDGLVMVRHQGLQGDVVKIPVACPKPAKRGPKERAPKLKNREPMKRVRVKARNAKRGGSSFPKQRDAKYRRWVWTENPCMLRGATIRVRFSEHDEMLPVWGYVHRCWGAITPAHVGKHQAKGAPDFGVLVPLCQAAHQQYDEHRDEWPRVTRYDEKAMASAASGYALKYVEQGGAPSPDPQLKEKR